MSYYTVKAYRVVKDNITHVDVSLIHSAVGMVMRAHCRNDKFGIDPSESIRWPDNSWVNSQDDGVPAAALYEFFFLLFDYKWEDTDDENKTYYEGMKHETGTE